MNRGTTNKGKKLIGLLLMHKQHLRRFKKLDNNEKLQRAGFDTALFDELQSEFILKEIFKGLGIFSRYLFGCGLVEIALQLSNISILQWKYPNNPVRQILEVKSPTRLFRHNGLVRSRNSPCTIIVSTSGDGKTSSKKWVRSNLSYRMFQHSIKRILPFRCFGWL